MNRHKDPWAALARRDRQRTERRAAALGITLTLMFVALTVLLLFEAIR